MLKEKRLVPQLRFSEFETFWQRRKLGEKCLKIGDGLHGTPKYSYNSKIYFINGNNINSGKIEIYEKTKQVSLKDYTKNNKGINSNSLLISLNGTIGNIGWYNNELVMLGKSVGYLTFSQKPLFEYHYLNTPKAQRFFISQLTGTTIKNLSLKTLRETSVFFPQEQQEQQKIANFLTAIDDRIQTLEKKKTLLEQYKKGVMQKIFKQELRFKDEYGKAFPEWEFKNGNLLFKSISDKNHNSDLPILAVTQDQGAIPRHLIDYNIGVTTKSLSSYKVVQMGDFIISLRSFQGGIEYSNYKGICSPAYIILKPIKEMDKTFYKYYLKTPNYIQELTRKLEGIRDGKMVSYKYFSEIKLPYPSIEEQSKIANFLSTIDKNIALVTKKIEHTKTYKKGLLQQMFV
jgi:type I restriction enzyme S subunit